MKQNILDFWEENKITYHLLYKIAMVVLGAPPTQLLTRWRYSISTSAPFNRQVANMVAKNDTHLALSSTGAVG
ncbi:hypothetical protein TNCV_3692391 [Trichonephila clavipes]|nr:hypothetical protein TNCV_3692391 [Trichonephila clavipes]